MAWQNFIYSYFHAMREVGTSAISQYGTWSTTNPKDYLIDDRAGALATFTTTSASHYIQVDRGSGTPTAITRCIIPEGHNLDGVEVRVRAADNAEITSGVTTLVNSVTADSEIFDQSFSSNQQRYVRMDFPNDDFNPQLPEIIYTYAWTPSAGPEPPWEDYYIHNTLDFGKESGSIASLSLGADRRYFRLTYRHVDNSTDLSIFSNLISTCGTSRPFYLDPPFTGEDPIWVKLQEDSRQSLDRASAGSPNSARPLIELVMLEHLA